MRRGARKAVSDWPVAQFGHLKQKSTSGNKVKKMKIFRLGQRRKGRSFPSRNEGGGWSGSAAGRWPNSPFHLLIPLHRQNLKVTNYSEPRTPQTTAESPHSNRLHNQKPKFLKIDSTTWIRRPSIRPPCRSRDHLLFPTLRGHFFDLRKKKICKMRIPQIGHVTIHCRLKIVSRFFLFRELKSERDDGTCLGQFSLLSPVFHFQGQPVNYRKELAQVTQQVANFWNFLKLKVISLELELNWIQVRIASEIGQLRAYRCSVFFSE